MIPWRKCSTCKAAIAYDAPYWVCSVSTCNRKRTGLVFCSVDCWDEHVPLMRHKDAWTEQRRSPASPDADPENSPTPASPGERRADAPSAAAATPPEAQPGHPSPPQQELDAPPADEILVVASKVKTYIRQRSGLNTSAGVMEELSRRIRRMCDEAMRSALQNERKTVLDRDF